jgi:hypothetical protein
MKCPKCRGLMVTERFVDFFMVRLEHRCLCCGNIKMHSLRHIRDTEVRPSNSARWGRGN